MSETAGTGASIESKKDFEKTPSGKYKYWAEELKSSMLARKRWWKQADKITQRYVGKSSVRTMSDDTAQFDLNLFHSNTKTLGDMLYGNTPKIDVSRRFAQSDDDVGRVAAEMMERLLNLEIADNGAEIDAVFRSVLQDRLLSGLGCAKVRYTMESEQVPVVNPQTGEPAYDQDGKPMMEDKLISEDAPIDYFYWGDILWGWCRNWASIPWIAFRTYLTKDQIEARWGKQVADDVKLKKQTTATSDEGSEERDTDSAWMRAEVWEVWNKDDRTVHWIIMGYDKQLEEKEDPLQLSGFWPVPPFFLANATTSLYTPTPDFVLAQDLYNEVDKLQTRISIITEAVRVVGVYNASADNLKQMFNAGMDNDLIPVENWALFGENGGLAGQIAWLPLADIVGALQQLIGVRDQTIQLLQQVTGMTDVMRGSLDNQYEGVGQTDAKTKFGSVRIQALQDQFARFAGDLMQLKAEVIARHFNPETIFNRANMQFSKDIELVQPAIELIKNPDKARLRIEIRPESVAMVDFQALKQERTDYLTAIGTFMQSAVSMMDLDPASKPLLYQLLQWGMAGFKGASEIEGILDKAIEQSQKAQEEKAANPQPDPDQAARQAAQQMEEFKANAAMELEQLKQQGDLGKIQSKAEADVGVRNNDLQADTQSTHETHVRKMAEIEAGLRSKQAEVQMALQADLLMEQAQTASNIAQTNATVEGEIKKDVVEAQIDLATQEEKTKQEIAKIAMSASLDIQKAQAAAEIKDA